MKNFTKIKRSQWAQLAQAASQISEADLQSITALGDVVETNDVNEVYMPLVAYLHLFIQNQKQLKQLTAQFTHLPQSKSPFTIGISGSVAVGKSTTARLLQVLLKRCYPALKVQLMTTDGFLYPNRELEKRRLMDRKGFPESYNMKLLSDFLGDVTSGKEKVLYPLYSQELSDIVPGQYGKVTNPDILIIEGINVLQLPPIGTVVTSDFFDFSIYLDADEELIRSWFMKRFVHLLEINHDNPDNFYYSWANGPREKALAMAEDVWQSVNLLNLREYIAPTKARANIVLHKTSGHRIDKIYLRHY